MATTSSSSTLRASSPSTSSSASSSPPPALFCTTRRLLSTYTPTTAVTSPAPSRPQRTYQQGGVTLRVPTATAAAAAVFGRRSGRTLLSGGLLQTTRVTHALVPVAQPLAHNANSNANLTSISSSSGSSGGSGAYTSAPRFNTLSGTVMTGHVHPSRSPTDLLDDMPVYKPDDRNGPPPTWRNSYAPMHSLPGSLAIQFYFRRVGEGGSGSGVGGGGDSAGATLGGAAEASSSSASLYDGGAASREPWGDGRSSGRRRPPAAEQTMYCRLCRTETKPDVSLRSHISLSGVGLRDNHVVREVALDTMSLLGVRGYPVDDIVTVWAETLFRCPEFPRLHRLSNPRWSIERRAQEVGDLMRALRKSGVIDVSLDRQVPEVAQPGSGDATYQRRRRIGFERLEYIGDSFWSVNISYRLVQLYPDQRWLHSVRGHAFNAIRDACEMNSNLDFVFDMLRIGDLLPTTAVDALGVKKVKADLVEALLGELQVYVTSFEPQLCDDVAFVEVNGARESQVCAVVQHCLTELYDLVVLQHARHLASGAMPLAKELAARRIWLPTRPLLLSTKRVHRASDRTASPSRMLVTSASLAATRGGGVAAIAKSVEPGGSPRGFSSTSSWELAAMEELFDLAPSVLQSSSSSFTEDRAGDKTDVLPLDHQHDVAASVGEATADVTLATAAMDATHALALAASSSPPPPAATSAPAPLLRSSGGRVLPGLPRLFDSPRACPATVAHPLRRLPLSAIPRATYCEETRSDILGQLIASYGRLGLVDAAAPRPRYVMDQRPAQWGPLIATLAPQLAALDVAPAESVLYEHYGEEDDDDAFVDGSSSSSKGSGGDAFTAGREVPDSGDEGGEAVLSRRRNVTGTAAVRTLTGEVQSGEATRRLLASIEDGDVYCRDAFYDLAASLCPPGNEARTSQGVEWVVCNAGLPTLRPKPSVGIDEGAGGRNGKDGGGSDGFGTFADSQFVPPHTRPPTAGVVTDRNLCRGVFAFLACGEVDPVGQAMESEDVSSARHLSSDIDQRSVKAAATASSEEDSAEAKAAAEKIAAAVAFWKRRQPRVTDILAETSGDGKAAKANVA